QQTKRQLLEIQNQQSNDYHIQTYQELSELLKKEYNMLIQHYNVMQALRHIIDGWKDSQFDNTMYATENTILYSENEITNNESPICQDKNFINIKLKDQWSTKKLQSIGLSNILNENHLLFRDLYKTYAKYFELRSIHIGDIIELEKNSERIDYAKVRLIFMHQANDGHSYTFFLVDRFQDTNTLNSILE
ncbi:7929_t:CDS:2, partial [Scutellospora calospora]